MQLPRSRLNAISRPWATSPTWAVSGRGIVSPSTFTAFGASALLAGTPRGAPARSNVARQTGPDPLTSGPQAHVLQGQRVDRLAGRRVDGVEHGGRGHADGRLADAAPEAARG